MRRIIYLCLLLILPTLSLKAENGYGLEGVYTNMETFDQIQIDAFKRGIRVKGLHGVNPHKWYNFKRVNQVTFANSIGDRIILERRHHAINKLIFKGRRGHVDVYRKGVPYHNTHGHHAPYGNSWSNQNYNWNDGYGYYDNNDYNRNRNNGDRHNRYNKNRNGQDSYNSYGSLEGTYKSDNNKIVAIVMTRDGFKAKFSGDRSWKNYERSGNAFFDKDGNKYILEGNDRLVWQGKYSGKQIRLTKIDDEVRF